MEDNIKKESKLGLIVCIVIIFILLATLVVMYYYGFIKKDNAEITMRPNDVVVATVEDNTENKNNIIDNKLETKTSVDENGITVYYGLDAITRLNKTYIDSINQVIETKFEIEDIQKSGDKYKITANIIDTMENYKKLNKEECDKILNGETFKFRNAEWKVSDKSGYPDYITISSGEYQLNLQFPTKDHSGNITNCAGEVSELSDYAKERVIFEVDEDVIVGSYSMLFKIDDDGKISISSIYSSDDENDENEKVELSDAYSIKELIENYKNSKDGYSECAAYIWNNEVLAIKFNSKMSHE